MFLNIKSVIASLLAIIILSTNCVVFAEEKSVATEYYSEDILCNISSVSENTTVLDIKAKSVVLMEAKTGTILYEKNADEIVAPASITKIMSLLLIMEAIENEQMTLNETVSTSEHAASMGGSQIWLEVGETMTVDEMLRATVIASANDATVALAEHLAGSEEAFVLKMNERAKELKMTNTTFKNACGLDEDGHVTSARDVAIMSSALIKHELIKQYSTVWMDALRDGKSELVNTNKLVRYYKGATGLKTGTTSNAGCCVSATAKRDNMELVAVVMKGENSNERFSSAKKLLDFGFANWEFTEPTFDEGKIPEIKCKKGMEEVILPQISGGFSLLTEKGNKGKLESNVEIFENITAPVALGQEIGRVSFTFNGKKVGEIPITAKNAVQKIDFFKVFVKILASALMP